MGEVHEEVAGMLASKREGGRYPNSLPRPQPAGGMQLTGVWVMIAAVSIVATQGWVDI